MEGIDIGTDADDLTPRSELVKKFPFVKLSAGIGPWGLREGTIGWEKQVEILSDQLDTHKVVAIGEIGLDNHWDYGTKESQEALLEAQIELANNRNLPVIFHDREADDQFIRLLRKHSFAKRSIFHCFQGSEELAKLAIHKDFFISFAGPLTYKANKNMQEIFANIPIEHILLETDSPYLSPNPMRGKSNTPLNMQYIYRYAAELRNMELDDLILQVRTNFQTFLQG